MKSDKTENEKAVCDDWHLAQEIGRGARAYRLSLVVIDDFQSVARQFMEDQEARTVFQCAWGMELLYRSGAYG